MKVSFNVLRKFSLSKVGQNFYKKVLDPKHENFFNNTLPTIETVVSTACYMVATQTRKKLDKEEKSVLQTQNLLGGVVGVFLGSFFNKKVSKLANAVIPHLNADKIQDIHKIVGGLKVGLPLLATGLTMRFLIPIFTAQVSTWREDWKRNKVNSKELDKLA